MGAHPRSLAIVRAGRRKMSEVKTAPRPLVELNPRWFGIYGAEGSKVGVTFDCPCGLDDCAWGGKIVISFKNPISGNPEPVSDEKLWQRTGETFESLTLAPSINCVGHWHGFLTNGVLVSC
jgi:Family of unknown function (DUF6527)